jgi:hypothetical protein
MFRRKRLLEKMKKEEKCPDCERLKQTTWIKEPPK